MSTQFRSRMAALSQDMPLTALVLPGTHDTMTAACTHPYYRTQTLDLATQLDLGVRFLDLRLRHRDGEPLVAAHREWISTTTGEEILTTLETFLREHPEETVIARFQNANENKDDFPAYGADLLALVREHLDLFWQPPAPATDSDSVYWPTLGQARGKVVALECAPAEFGLLEVDGRRWATAWHDNPVIALQDDWDGPDLQDKVGQITNLYAGPGKDTVLRLNHVSATNGDLGNPLAYAEIINPQTAELVAHQPGRGVLILDFATPDLVDACWHASPLA